MHLRGSSNGFITELVLSACLRKYGMYFPQHGSVGILFIEDIFLEDAVRVPSKGNVSGSACNHG